MKRFTSQYVFTNSGSPLKRAVITCEDDGTIISIEDTAGDLKEKHSTEFFNGIITPGFVNCHCHLELSHLKGSIRNAEGLGNFIEQVRNNRNYSGDSILSAALTADNYMYSEGIVFCADVCNTSDSFSIKKESRISYINLLEVFGIDPEKAAKRMDELMKLASTAQDMELLFSLVPHSVYSMSLSLLRLLKDECSGNSVTSIHFMETAGEEALLNDRTGSLMSSYVRSGLLPLRLETARNHADAVLNEITRSGNLILVHNTFCDKNTISRIKERNNLFWCLCPKSNIYIENKLPPVDLLINERCEIVLGTDSLASNSALSILEEIKIIQKNFPYIAMENLIAWATINGARALGVDKQFGSIEPGKKPGLLLLQNVDLQNMNFLPDSFVTRLI
jgi:cytosine/adenosine deaminase-related metal-dependent hydrolase